MIWQQWRERLIIAAMSVVVAWHTLAMVLAPAPDSNVSVRGLRVLLRPYLTALRLDSEWNFFAPNVSRPPQLRYLVEDSAGNLHTFVPAQELNFFHPSYIWFTFWYDTVIESPDVYGAYFAAALCRKHAALNPVSITFQEVTEHDFWPEDRRSGKHPLDAEFIEIKEMKRIRCSDGSARSPRRPRLRPMKSQ